MKLELKLELNNKMNITLYAVCTTLVTCVLVFTDVDKPYIDNIDIGEDFFIVSWKPSTDPPSNPASEFVVEYRPEGWDC